MASFLPRFYDDQPPFWNPWTELVANDCLYYCIAEGLDSFPTCVHPRLCDVHSNLRG